MKPKQTRETIKKYVYEWTYKLGLRWWEVETYCVTDQRTIDEELAADGVVTVLARAYADWRYCTVKVYFNLPAMCMLTENEIERTIVHEFVHALVNEMRETGVDHEERVVTYLTKAFLWTKEGSKEENKEEYAVHST